MVADVIFGQNMNNQWAGNPTDGPWPVSGAATLWRELQNYRPRGRVGLFGARGDVSEK